MWEYAEPDYIYHTSVLPSDPDYSKQWYLDKNPRAAGLGQNPRNPERHYCRD